MITVQLHDVKINAAHGIYDGEEILGNPYIVNLDVTFDEGSNDMGRLSNTIDYVELFEIVKTRMMRPSGLLEKLCDSIVRHLHHQYPFIKEVNLSIYKLQAPIPNFHGRVGVTMNKKFDD